MTDFITKPFIPLDLVRCVLRHATGSRPSAVVPGPAVDTAADVPESWPVIEGIDVDAAQPCFGGDVALFLRLLGRLVHDFSGVSARDLPLIHKLKGCAGLLGALSVHRLAGSIEAAVAAGDANGVARLGADLTRQLKALRNASAAARDAAVKALASPDAAGEPPLEPGELVDLAKLLRLQSLAAVDRFHSLAVRLRRHMGADAYARLRANVDLMQFSDAVESWRRVRGRIPGVRREIMARVSAE